VSNARKAAWRKEPFNGPARQAAGLTVFVGDARGRKRTLVRNEMPLRAALREICEQIDHWDGEWFIECISTPSTIYRDLQGRREEVHAGTNLKAVGVNHGGVSEPVYVEEGLLGAIGRGDLWRRPTGGVAA
jgi:hypothetical protein